MEKDINLLNYNMKFLSKYFEHRQEIKVAVDALCLASFNGEEFILLIKREYEPFRNYWALPGGFLHNDEEFKEGVKRELKEETNIDCDVKKMKELGVFGDVGRDPRRRIISIAFLIKFDYLPEVSIMNETVAVKWIPLKDIKSGEIRLAFDHDKVLEKAMEMSTSRK